jgi:hypothetical protein
MTEEPEPSPGSPDLDPRVTALRQRLNESFFEVHHGEYFRSRVHGWAAYLADVDVQLPEGVAERLSTPFEFSRNPDAEYLAAVDAFVIAYHAAETFWRYLFACLDGSGPVRAPLVAMAELKAGRPFNERVSKCLSLGESDVRELLTFAFLPPEFEEVQDGEPSVEAVREYLASWWRELARFTTEWRNAYNAAKHGVAAGVRPLQLAFVSAEAGSGPPIDFMNGPVMRTLEHEPRLDAEGRRMKDETTGQPILRWLWVYRAIDPDELIAQTIVTADLLDWLRAIAGARLLGRTGTPVHVRDEPKPKTLRRRATPGLTFRIDIGAVPLPPGEAAEVMRRLEVEESNELDQEGPASS